jgi:tetratricopeptide (TPR) repeat protein
VKSLEPPDTFHLSAALGWLGLGNWVEASEELEHISRPLRAHPEVLDVRWQICSVAGNWEQAAEIACTLVQLQPEEPQHWISQAYATRRMTKGGIAQAREILTKARLLFPKEFLIAYNLACYECQLGNSKGALKWLKTAFDLGDAKQIKLMALTDLDLKPIWPAIAKT